jgi:hypothetical protein
MHEPNASTSVSTVQDRDAAYRQHIAAVLLAYTTRNGQVPTTEAYRQIIDVALRSMGTVKNWIAYRVNFPDLASLARIVDRWKIPPELIFPPNLGNLLAGETHEVERHGGLSASADHILVPLVGLSDPTALEQALSSYTRNPQTAVFVRQDSSEMLDEIRPGELMLVDPTCEQVRGSGLYFLRIAVAGQPDKTCTRHVDMLMGEPAVRLRSGSASAVASAETLPLVGGGLPAHITILGKVIGVLRQV